VGTSVALFGNNDDPAFSYENLTAARLVSTILGALMVVFVFYIGKLLFNRFIGISFALLVLFHGLVIFNSRLIMLEIFSHFFLIFSFLLFIKAISNGKINLKILLFSAALCSLGLITKFYEVVALVPIVIILIILRNDFRKKIDKHLIRNRFFTNSLPISFLFCVIIACVFFIPQPFFWDQPIEQLNVLRDSVDVYAPFHPPFSPEIQLHYNVGAIVSATIAPIADLYFYNFSDYVPNFGGPGNTVISNFSTVPLTALFIIGISFLTVDLYKKNFEFSKLILVSWYFFTFLMLALTIDSYQYDRYWFGLFFPMMFIASYGTYRLTKNLNKFITFTFVAVSILTHALSIFIFWEILYAGSTVALTPPFPISLQESITIPLIYSFNIIFCIFAGGLIIKNLRKQSISN
jgi:4-amino-4-deoxy-L-arabinose transferase-like glycosyltransferase